MPISGSRKQYKIDLIKVGEDKDEAGGRPIVVKMKEPIANYFGLDILAFDDPLLTGTFQGTGLNSGFKYRKRLGGYRYESFTLVAITKFNITERVQLPLGFGAPIIRQYKSISIGFPKGVSVREFINWVASTNRNDKISYIVTPRGARHPITQDNFEGNDAQLGEGGVIEPAAE